MRYLEVHEGFVKLGESLGGQNEISKKKKNTC
jgi:hypothetical protein